ncbi:MAG: hypothetical protein ACTSUE_08360 [Promethearchaeota archaeon]
MGFTDSTEESGTASEMSPQLSSSSLLLSERKKIKQHLISSSLIDEDESTMEDTDEYTFRGYVTSSPFSSSDEYVANKPKVRCLPGEQQSTSVNNMWKTEGSNYSVIHHRKAKTARFTAEPKDRAKRSKEHKGSKSPRKKKTHRKPTSSPQHCKPVPMTTKSMVVIRKGRCEKKKKRKKKKKKTPTEQKRFTLEKSGNSNTEKKQNKRTCSPRNKRNDDLHSIKQLNPWNHNLWNPKSPKHSSKMGRKQSAPEVIISEKKKTSLQSPKKKKMKKKKSTSSSSPKEDSKENEKVNPREVLLSPRVPNFLNRLKEHVKIFSSANSGSLLMASKNDTNLSKKQKDAVNYMEDIDLGKIRHPCTQTESDRWVMKTSSKGRCLSPEKLDFIKEMHAKYGEGIAFGLMQTLNEIPHTQEEEKKEKEEERPTSGGSSLKMSPSITKLALDTYGDTTAPGKTRVTIRGKILTGPVLRVSSEEHLVSAAMYGDQILSPREIEDMQVKAFVKKVVLSTRRSALGVSGGSYSSSSSSIGDTHSRYSNDESGLIPEYDEDSVTSPIYPSCSISHCGALQGEELRMTRKQANASKLLWLLVGNDHYDVNSRNSLARIEDPKVKFARQSEKTNNRSPITHSNSSPLCKSFPSPKRSGKRKSKKRRGRAIVTHGRKRSHSVDHNMTSSGRKRTLCYSYGIIPGVDSNSSLGRSLGRSDPWESECMSSGEDGRMCLSPRESKMMREKDSSEKRLCYKVLFSISGGMFTDNTGRIVYNNIDGIRVSDNKALVQGAYQCTFTGDYMILHDIIDCQVLGSGCRVKGQCNFIRGTGCVVSGFGNVIHVKTNTIKGNGNNKGSEYPTSIEV